MHQPNFAVQAKLQSGFALHQQGRLREAETIYLEVLSLDKNNADALHLIGVICYQTERHEQAVDFISKAIKISPGAAMPYYNRGNALKALNRRDEAVANYNKAISLNPQYVDAYNNRGIALNGMRRFQEALASYNKAIELQRNFAEAYNNRGFTLDALERHDEAIASYNTAISLNPRYAEAYNNRGLSLSNLGRLAEALASHNRAIEINPAYAEAYNNRGNVLSALKRHDEALADYGRAIELKSGYAEAHNNRGNALHGLRRSAEAIASYNRAIEINADYAEAYNNLGNVLRVPRSLDAALASFDRAIELKPDFAEAYANRGKAFSGLKRFDEALASFDKAIALRPGFAGAHFNKAQLGLLLADFADGWKNYEWRKSIESPAGNRSYPKPLLTSLGDAAGKTILVHWEQGLGDTIHICRYVSLLGDRGAKVLFAPQGPLKKLFQTLDPRIDLVDAEDRSLSFDFHVPLMSLPLLFETGLETIPATVPYLFADPVLARQWKEKLQTGSMKTGCMKIGISWQGNPSHTEDAFRSFPVSLFEPLAHIANVRLFSLQMGHGAEQLQALPAGMTVETLTSDFIAGADSIANTAAVISNLDLVISSDTAVAHLAGALGAPTWVAIHLAPDWRWLLDRSDSPWYPSMRLFRQASNGDWKSVFEEMKTALLDSMAGRS